MRYRKYLIVIFLIDAIIFLITLYFSDKVLVTKSWGDYEFVNIRFSNELPYRYLTCQIRPIVLFNCQVNTIIKSFPNPEALVTPTQIPVKPLIQFGH